MYSAEASKFDRLLELNCVINVFTEIAIGALDIRNFVANRVLDRRLIP